MTGSDDPAQARHGEIRRAVDLRGRRDERIQFAQNRQRRRFEIGAVGLRPDGRQIDRDRLAGHDPYPQAHRFARAWSGLANELSADPGVRKAQKTPDVMDQRIERQPGVGKLELDAAGRGQNRELTLVRPGRLRGVGQTVPQPVRRDVAREAQRRDVPRHADRLDNRAALDKFDRDQRQDDRECQEKCGVDCKRAQK